MCVYVCVYVRACERVGAYECVSFRRGVVGGAPIPRVLAPHAQTVAAMRLFDRFVAPKRYCRELPLKVQKYDPGDTDTATGTEGYPARKLTPSNGPIRKHVFAKF